MIWICQRDRFSGRRDYVFVHSRLTGPPPLSSFVSGNQWRRSVFLRYDMIWMVKGLLTGLGLCALLVECAHDRGHPQSRSIFRSTDYPEDTLATLNETANDQTEGQEDRARAIFTLFGRYVRPGCSSPEFHQVAPDVGWLARAKLSKITMLGGWIPIDMTFEDSDFCLQLFASPTDERASQWHIYFRLTGQLQPSDALAFLRGAMASGSSTRMQEFALCLPHSIYHPDRAMGRIERFSTAGVHVYEEMGR